MQLPTLSLSRWTYRGRGKTTPTFLQLLGVPFRRAKGQSFWDANRHQLLEIFEAMQEEARDRLREIHPDHGGDTAQFQAFISDLRRVQKAFRWELPQTTPKPTNSAVTIGRHRNPRKILAALQLAREGKSSRKIAAELSMSSSFVCKMVRRYAPETLCKCGRAWSHRGTCKARDDRAWFKHLPAESLRRMRQARTGKISSPEHRRKIGDALRGKPKTAEHVFKSVLARTLNGSYGQLTLSQGHEEDRPAFPLAHAYLGGNCREHSASVGRYQPA